MSRWFRAYDDALDDPKVQLLPDTLFRAWFNLMCVSSKNKGAPFSLQEVEFRLRITSAKAQSIVSDLLQRGLLDEDSGRYISHNWASRQFKSDVSNERVKRHRERNRNDEGNTECNVTGNGIVAPPETEQNRTEDRTEKINARAREDSDFEIWYTTYPRHEGKGQARKAYRGALKKTDAATLLQAAHAAREQYSTVEKQFVPMPATWLNGERWADEKQTKSGDETCPDEIYRGLQ